MAASGSEVAGTFPGRTSFQITAGQAAHPPPHPAKLSSRQARLRIAASSERGLMLNAVNQLKFSLATI